MFLNWRTIIVFKSSMKSVRIEKSSKDSCFYGFVLTMSPGLSLNEKTTDLYNDISEKY